MNFLLNVTWFSESVCTHVTLRALSLSLFEQHCHFVLLMMEWVCRWKLCWILFGDTFPKAYFEDLQF